MDIQRGTNSERLGGAVWNKQGGAFRPTFSDNESIATKVSRPFESDGRFISPKE